MESSENDNVTNESAPSAAQQNVDIEQKIENHKTESTAEQMVAPTATTCEATKKTEEVTGESKANGEKQQKNDENKDAMSKQTEELKDGKEVEGGQSTASPRAQKKTKKTKKKEAQQQPLSEQAIPLPPPPPTESAK